MTLESASSVSGVASVSADLAAHADMSSISQGSFNPISSAFHEPRVAVDYVGKQNTQWIGQRITVASKNGDEVFDWSTVIDRLTDAGKMSLLTGAVEDVPVSALPANKADEYGRLRGVHTKGA